jgi:hypothetical protein
MAHSAKPVLITHGGCAAVLGQNFIRAFSEIW